MRAEMIKNIVVEAAAAEGGVDSRGAHSAIR